MRKDRKNKIAAILFFSFLTFLHLLPLSKNPGRTVHDPGDPLLNTWILGSVQKNLLSRPLNIFEANSFYPHSRPLAYSELLFPQAVLTLPLRLVAKNPLLSHNLILLLSFLFIAFAMFLLVRHLTENNLAGIASGIVFAFNAYHLSHLAHLQLLSSGFIPLSILFLHRFVEKKRLTEACFFSAFFILQGLACVYYGLFFLSVLIIALPVLFLVYRKELEIGFFLKLAVPLGFAGLLLYWLFRPYAFLFRTLSFDRELAEGANLAEYLAVPPKNILWGKLLSGLGRDEHFLFPGMTALLLTVLFLFWKRQVLKALPHVLRMALLVVLAFSLFSLAAIILTGGFSLNLRVLEISAVDLAMPVVTTLAAMVLGLVLCLVFFTLKGGENSLDEDRHLLFYLFIFFWALTLSFGKSFSAGSYSFSLSLPFRWLYDFLPWFKGIREPSRYAVFVLFSLSVLAGYGVKHLFLKIDKKPLRAGLATFLLFILNAEYASIPHRASLIPVSTDIPPTYRWLEKREGNFALLEIPALGSLDREAILMYFSLFHGKKIVNGYSGFIPPASDYIRRTFNAFPSPSCLDVLKTLKVKYLVLHTKAWKDDKVEIILRRIDKSFKGGLIKVREFDYRVKPWSLSEKFGRDIIYEVKTDEDEEKAPEQWFSEELAAESWEIQSNINQNRLIYARDKSLETGWTTGRPRKNGDYLLVVLKEPLSLDRVALDLGGFPYDFAVNIRAEASRDGENWEIIEGAYSAGEFVQHLVFYPQKPIQAVHLKGTKLQYLKLIQTGNDRKYPWSVAEVKIYQEKIQEEKAAVSEF